MYIPRLRKKENVIKDVKKIDPKTAITSCLIEKLAESGKITQIKYGNAWLINLDELFDFFTTKEQNNEKTKNR
jgi:hypothetical protein